MVYNITGGGGGTGASLTVTAPAGCTVTVSKDGKTKTRTAGADGVAVFKGLSTGTWTVTITDGEQTAQKTVTVTTDYSTAITFFSATIHITYPAGSICTATDGVTTLTAPDTSGTWDCVVPNAGTWTVSLDSGFAENVTISENGETQTLNKWYLYNCGDERTYTTGGWAAYAYKNSNSGSAVRVPTVTFGTDYLRIRMPKAGTDSYNAGSIFTEKAVDLTNVKSLYIDISSFSGSNASANFLVTETKENKFVIAASTKVTKTGTFAIDVSSLSGRYYAVFEISGVGGTATSYTVDITRIYGE